MNKSSTINSALALASGSMYSTFAAGICSHTACGASKIAPMSSPMLTPDEAIVLKCSEVGYVHFRKVIEAVSGFQVL